MSGSVVLASHAERGEIWDKAAHYPMEALEQATRSSSNHEAVALYDRLLVAINRLPGDAGASLSVDARLRVFSPLLALGEIERLTNVMREAAERAEALGDRRRLGATSQPTFLRPVARRPACRRIGLSR